MSFETLLSIAGAALLSIGGGTSVVFVLSKYLGEIWATRILENEREIGAREQELLIRRRNIYTRLTCSLRVFLHSNDPITLDQRREFLAAYDEAALWATEGVMSAVGDFLDKSQMYTANAPGVPLETYKTAYEACILAMRKDAGFPHTAYRHRLVSF